MFTDSCFCFSEGRPLEYKEGTKSGLPSHAHPVWVVFAQTTVLCLYLGILLAVVSAGQVGAACRCQTWEQSWMRQMPWQERNTLYLALPRRLRYSRNLCAISARLLSDSVQLSRPGSNLLYSCRLPWTCDLSASTSVVLGLQMRTTTCGLWSAGCTAF